VPASLAARNDSGTFSERAISPIAAVLAAVRAARSSVPLTPSMLPPPSMISGSPLPPARLCFAFQLARIDCFAVSLIGVGNLKLSRLLVPVFAIADAQASRFATSSSCIAHLSSGLSPIIAQRE